MKKLANIICLIAWCIVLGMGIITLMTGGTIHPLSYICACLICVMHYAEELIWGDRD